MRQIYIDLTSERAKPPAQAVGCVGEHNATELLISVPQPLIDASDYQVVVFQSGPLTFRSRRIYPDSDRDGAYREGVCIHCLLGRHLTVEQCLGLQVEGWKLGTDGQPSLIGKTAFLPRLTLTASPQGRPGLGFDGSYEDIQRAIDRAHKHENMPALLKVGEDESGGFTFGGRLLEPGAVRYVAESPDALPADAAEGTLSYVRNDTVAAGSAALDLTDCPYKSDVESTIATAYAQTGGMPYDNGWYDFYNNYTNCDFSERSVKLATPIYRSNFADFQGVALYFGNSFGNTIGEVKPVEMAIVNSVAEGEKNPVFVANGDYTYGYIPGMSQYDPPAQEITEDGTTKHKITLGCFYAFEPVSGEFHNTSLDGFPVNLAAGWNYISAISVMDDLGFLTVEKIETELAADDLFLPAFSCWSVEANDEALIDAAKTALSELLIDTSAQTVIPKGLYIKTETGWRWIG